MRIYIDRDHNAVEFTEAVVSALSALYNVVFLQSPLECPYPSVAEKLSKIVSKEKDALGILICKTGIGMSIVANKIKGIYAANCSTMKQCYMFKKNNMGNVLCLGANTMSVERAIRICKVFIETKFDDKNIGRINTIKTIEESNKP